MKSLYNLSDEGLVTRWLENPYRQSFIAVKVLQKRSLMGQTESDHRMIKHASVSFVSLRLVQVGHLENLISDIVGQDKKRYQS